MKNVPERCRMAPRIYIEKGWGVEMPYKGMSKFNIEPKPGVKIGEVFVYHPEHPLRDNPIFNVETVKLLYIAKDRRLSLHYHMKKIEIFHMIKGALLVTLINSKGGRDDILLEAGDHILVPAGMTHQMMGLEEENILLEVSTKDSPSDSYRIQKGD